MSNFERFKEQFKQEETQGRLYNLVRSIAGELPETDALTYATRYHLYYGGGEESFYSKYKNDSIKKGVNPDEDPEGTEERFLQDVVEEFSQEAVSTRGYNNQSSLGRALNQTIAYNAFSTFDTDLQYAISDSRNSLKNITGKFYIGNKENYDDQVYFSKLVYDNVYRDPTRSKLASRAVDDPNTDIRDHVLRSLINRDIAGVGSNIARINSEFENLFPGKRGQLLRTQESIDISMQQMLDRKYIDRPGVLPFINLFSSADTAKEIIVDSFQFQNKTISDFLYQKISDRIAKGDTGFKFTLRLGYPRTKQGVDANGNPMFEGAEDPKSYSILGPNLIEIMKYEALKEQLIARGVSKEKVGEMINIEVADKKHHPKLYMVDRIVALGTMNLTAPVGYSIHQSGSNFESIRLIQNKLTGVIKNADILSNKAYRDLSSEDKIETLLYHQVRSLLSKYDNNPNTKFTGNKNVGMSGDIFSHLESTVSYAAKSTGRKELYVILDQVMLLQHDSKLYKDKTGVGEFGDFNTIELDKVELGRHDRFRKVQEELLGLVAEGKAFVTADVRNLKESVIDPLYERIAEVEKKGTFDFKDYDYDLKLLAGFGTKNEKIKRLTEDFGFHKTTALVIAAFSTGNIRPTTTPRQHVKSFALFDIDTNKTLSTYMGSSNMGPFSSAMDLVDDYMSSTEYGLIFGTFDARGRRHIKGEYGLTKKQEERELETSGRAFSNTWTRLGMGTVGGERIKGKSILYDRIDQSNLEVLKNKLEEMVVKTGMNKEGFKVRYEYSGDAKRVGILVEIDGRSLTGFNTGFQSTMGDASKFNFRLTVLEGGGTEPGLVYAIDQGKVIGNSLFVNTSKQDISLPYGEEGKQVVKSGKSTKLSSIDSTLSILSTLAGEMIYRSTVAAPKSLFRGLDTNSTRGAILNYLSLYLGNTDGGLDFLTNEATPAQIYELSKNIFNKLTSDEDNTFKVIRSILNTDTDPNSDKGAKRIKLAEELSGMISEMANKPVPQRASRLVGSSDNAFSIVDKILSMMELFPELAVDIINSQRDMLISGAIQKDIIEVRKALFEPLITFGQVSTYGSSQAANRLPVYGVDDSQQYKRMLGGKKNAKEGELSNLYNYANAVSLTHNPLTSFGGAFIRGIASGGGTTPDPSGVRNSFLGTASQDVNTVFDLRVLESIGVGYSTSQKDIDEYIKYINDTVTDPVRRGRAIEAIKNGMIADTLTMTFDSPAKAAQIPQRLKNALGARPMMELTVGMQEILEKKDGIGIKEHLDEYLKGLRKEVTTAFNPALNKNINLEEALYRLVKDDMQIGGVYGAQIRKVVSREGSALIEKEREKIEDILGKESTKEGIGRELLRVAVMRAEVYGSSVRGLMGGSDRGGVNKPSVIFVQLAGAFTDYAYTNPDFGTIYNQDGSIKVEGIRQGFLERAEKRVKGSMLQSDWLGLSGAQVQKGDVIKFDLDSNSMVVIRDGEQIQTIDSRNQYDFIQTIENSRVEREGSVASLQGTSFSRPGEFSREFFLEVTELQPGSPESNQIIYEIAYLRNLKAHGGRRLEGSWAGSLLKAVPQFLTGLFGYDKDGKLDKTKKGIFAQLVEDWNKKMGEEIQLENVYGLFNPTNLKSFSYQHGSVILRNKDELDVLLKSYKNEQASTDKNNSKRLAVALLTTFGTSFLDGDTDEVLTKLGKVVASGEMGEYYQTLAAVKAGFTDFSGAKDEDAKLKILGKSLTKKSAFNIYQTPGLSNLLNEDLLKALEGDGNDLYSQIEQIIETARAQVKYEYIIVGNKIQTEAAILVSALDMFSQLTKDNNVFSLKTDIDVDNRDTFSKLATIAGFSREDIYSDDEEVQENIKEQLLALSTKSPLIRMYMDISSSQIKDPISSKYTAKLEMQHLTKPFFYHSSSFGKEGSLKDLQVVLANVFAAISEGSSIQYFNDDELTNVKMLDIFDPFVRSPVFKGKMLSIFSSAIEQDEFISLRREYNKKVTELTEGIREVIELEDGTKTSKITKDSEEHTRIIQELKVIEDKLHRVSRKYQLFSDKPAGIGLSETIVNSMSHKRFAFALPMVHISQTEEGNVLTFDRKNMQYGYLPGGEDLKAIGIQFGSFVEDIVTASINVVAGFAPGSLVTQVFDRVNTNRQVMVSDEELEGIKKFYSYSTDMIELLSAAAAGTRIQKAMGAGLSFEGGVTTGSASFLVPSDMVVLARETLDRSGLRVGKTRTLIENVIAKEYGQLVNQKKAITTAIEEKNLTTKEGKILRRENKERFDYLNAQKQAILQGVSLQGTYRLEEGRTYSQNLMKRFKDVNQLIKDNSKEAIKSLYEIAKDAFIKEKEYIKQIKGSKPGGDVFVSKLLKREMQLIRNQVFLTMYELTSSDPGFLPSEEQDLIKASKGSTIPSLNIFRPENKGIQKEKVDNIINWLDNTYNYIRGTDTRISKYMPDSYKYYTTSVSILEGFLVGKDGINRQEYLDNGEENPLYGRTLTDEQLEGSYRGKIDYREMFSGKFLKEMKGFTTNEKKAFLIGKVDNLIKGFEDLKKYLGRETDGGATPTAIKSLMEPHFDEINQIINELITNFGDPKHKPHERKGIVWNAGENVWAETLNNIINKRDTSSLMEVISFRSAPPGGTEPTLPLQRVIRGMRQLNAYADAIDPSGNKNLVQFSHDRNNTLTLFNPLSILATNLGDWDGDPISSIFSHINDVVYKIQDKQDRIEILNIQLNTNTKLLESLPDEEVDKVKKTERIIGVLDRRIETIRKEKGKLEKTLLDSRTNLNEKLRAGARREVADYIGIDERYFMSTEERDRFGNAGYLKKELDINVFFTYLEQGRGLFKSISGKAKELQLLTSVYNKLLTPDTPNGSLVLEDYSSKHPQQRIDNLDSKLKARAEVLMEVSGISKEEKSFYTNISQMEGFRKTVRKELTNFYEGNVEAIDNQIDPVEKERTYYNRLNSWVGGIYSRSTAFSEYNTYFTRAAGTSMAPDSYEVLSYILGKAGGDILGKTYNTIISTLYADSPILAIAHAITKDKGTETAIRNYYDSIRPEKGEKKLSGDDFITNVKQSMMFSEQLQGYMKNIHQLLRDSIKVKEGTDILEVLKKKAEEYSKEGATEDDKSKAINEIVEHMGPGPGLKALIRLDSLVGTYRGGITDDILEKKFGVNKEDKESILKKLEGMPGIEVAGTDQNKHIAAYRVMKDMQNLVLSFRFDIQSKGERSQLETILEAHEERMSRKKRPNWKIELNEEFKEVTSKGEKGIYRESLEQHYGKVGADLDKTIEELSLEHKILFATIHEKTIKSTKHFFGEQGQGLLRFVQYDEMREHMSSILQGNKEANVSSQPLPEGNETSFKVGKELINSDLTLTMLGLATSGKLSPAASSVFYQTMENLLKFEGFGKEGSGSKILEALVTSNNKYDNNNAPVQQMRKDLSILFRGKERLDITTQGGTPGGDKKIITNTYDKGFGEYLEKAIKDTELGVKSEAMRAFVTAVVDINKGEDGKGREINSWEEFVNNIMPNETTEQRQALAEKYKTFFVAPEGSSFISPSKRRSPYAGSEGAIDKILKSVSSQETGARLDFIVPALLSLAGGVISSASDDPEIFNNIVGSTLVAAAYSKGSFSRNVKNSLIYGALGSSFKVRQALNESQGNVGEGLLNLISRETVFHAANMTLAPVITNFVSERILQGSKYRFERDKMAGVRNVGGTITGAILSAVLSLAATQFAPVKTKQGVPGLDSLGQVLKEATDLYTKFKTAQSDIQEGASITGVNEDTGEEIPIQINLELSSFFNEQPTEAMENALVSTNFSDYSPESNTNFTSEPFDLFPA